MADHPSTPSPSSEPTGEGSSGSGWRSPAGVSVIIAAIAVVVTVVTFTIAEVRERERSAAGPTSVAVAGPTARADDGPAVDQLFVYGSSKPDRPRYQYIAHFVADSRPAQVEGLLYDTGADYPAAKFGIGRPIPGYVLTIKPGQEEDFFRQMDMIESGLFGRKSVTTLAGDRVWAYEWNGPTDGFTPIDEW